MASDDRLKALAGVYKQNDGNTFVVTLKDNTLQLKTDDIKSENLVARGDGLYDVQNTQAKIKFHLGQGGIAHSLTFYLTDRQTVATRDIPMLQEKSLKERFRELGIAATVFLALLGTFFLSYSPMKSACLNGGSPMVCRAAAISARVMGRVEDSKALASQESRQTYQKTNEETKEACEDGDVRACLEQAKGLARINQISESEKLLEKGCYLKKHGASCQFWRDLNVEKGNIDKADEIMKQGCEFGVAVSCYEWAWKLKKKDGMAQGITFFDKACELGEEKSCYELALHHLKFNRTRSQEYLISACQSFHRQACDLKEKVDKYFEHKDKCLNATDAHSCFLMASFEQDYGDKERALKEYQKACDLGYRLACNIVEKEKKVRELKERGTRIDTI